jgi:hypothetical protein
MVVSSWRPPSKARRWTGCCPVWVPMIRRVAAYRPPPHRGGLAARTFVVSAHVNIFTVSCPGCAKPWRDSAPLCEPEPDGHVSRATGLLRRVGSCLGCRPRASHAVARGRCRKHAAQVSVGAEPGLSQLAAWSESFGPASASQLGGMWRASGERRSGGRLGRLRAGPANAWTLARGITRRSLNRLTHPTGQG